MADEENIIVRCVKGLGERKEFLHFSGVIWTKNPAYAWTGTVKQLAEVRKAASPEVFGSSKARAEIFRKKK